MRILVTGANGRLGSALVERLAPLHDVTGTDLPALDLTRPDAVTAIADHTPHLVIHCAAWTDVDGCAQDPGRALLINATGTKHVALACQQTGAALMHVSTNEIFDGKTASPYQEYDRANPPNPYGYSKYIAEQIVRDHLTRFYIVRPSWLISHGGTNFLHAILNRARNNQRLRVVINEVAAPTYTPDLAEAMVRLLEHAHYGIYHLVNEGKASRWELARFTLDHAGFAEVPMEKIMLAQYRRPSTPPQFGVLRNVQAAHLGIVLRPWQEAVLEFLEKEGLT